MADLEARPRMDPVDALWSATWRLYKERLSALILIVLIPTILVALAQGMGVLKYTALSGLLVIAADVAFFWAALAMIVAFEKGAGVGAAYGESRSCFWPYAWVTILAILAIIGGLVMLIVPAILMGVWFSFTSFTVVIEGRRGFGALTQSREYARGYWWAIVGRMLLLMLAFIVAAAAVGIVIGILFAILGNGAIGIVFSGAVYLFMVPFAAAYSYNIYKNLARLKPELAAAPSARSRKFFLASAIVGLVAPIMLFIFASALFLGFIGGRFKPGTLQTIYDQNYIPASSTTEGTATTTGAL